MPKGIYSRENCNFEWARRNLIRLNKTEAGRERARKGGINGGKVTGETFNKSIAGRERAKKGGFSSIKYLIEHARSEEGKEKSRRNIAKVRANKTTACQKLLSKSLADIGIHNHMEHYFPEIKRLGDIAIPSLKLIIEVDGNSHFGIFCTKEEKQADDNLKDEQIRSLGWNIIRFKNEEVENNLEQIIFKISSSNNLNRFRDREGG